MPSLNISFIYYIYNFILFSSVQGLLRSPNFIIAPTSRSRAQEQTPKFRFFSPVVVSSQCFDPGASMADDGGRNVLETARADRSVWLMKCPPVVSRAWQAAAASSSSSEASATQPVVAKVVLSVDPLCKDDPSSVQVLDLCFSAWRWWICWNFAFVRGLIVFFFFLVVVVLIVIWVFSWILFDNVQINLRLPLFFWLNCELLNRWLQLLVSFGIFLAVNDLWKILVLLRNLEVWLLTKLSSC